MGGGAEDPFEHYQDLIERIYAAAEEPGRWQALLAELDALEAKTDPRWLRHLETHLQRALRLQERLQAGRGGEALTQVVAERLPLALLWVDEALTLLDANARGRALLSDETPLCLREGRLHGPRQALTEALRSLVRDALTGAGPATLSLPGPPMLSLMAITGGEGSPRCLLVLAHPQVDTAPDPDLLCELFRLSPAEARLSARLTAGESLEEAARALHITRNTARSQLKAVFAKTGARRQSELIRHILTSPALLRAEGDAPPARAAGGAVPAGRAGHVRLADGRRLAFAQYGDEDGLPVVFLHSIVGSRAQIHPDRACREALGIRWICPERPGYGHSDPRPGRTLLDWADDLDRLADHLGLERFHLAGHSAGGAFALAYCRRHPGRVRRLALVSPMPPFRHLRELAGMPPTNRMLLGLARHAPRLLGPFMRLMLRGLMEDPEQITQRHAELWPEADRTELERPGRRAFLTELFRQATRQGPEAIVQEQILLARPWGFRLEDIPVDTRLWHGDGDIHVPLSLTRALDALPRLTRHILPGEGHYLYLRHWRAIFDDLLH